MITMVSLSGKTALVTGGGKRIGRSVAISLARLKCNVIVHYNASERAADEVVQISRGEGVNAWKVQSDLSDPSSAESLFDRCLTLTPKIEVLINSASIFPESTLAEVTQQELYDNINVNALSPFMLARRFAEQKIEAAIINFLDTRILDYDKNHVAYHTSKRMLHTLTRMMSIEFAPDIRVNAVAPGLVLPPPGKDNSYLEQLASTNPLNAFGDVEDISAAVIFLLESSFVTGQIIYVDGGRHLKGNFYGS